MALRVESVSKRFGAVRAVQDVSFSVSPGRVCGLLGSNGAGKTTTMRMIMRIYWPDEGSITWNGAPVTDQVRETFGYLPEERGLYPKMPVREQLIYLTELKGLSRRQAAECVDRWISRLHLAEYANRRAEQLSKGNQQKVQFAAAVASGPQLCILDEPFTGLDPVNTVVMEEAFRTVAAEGTTLLFSSHNMDQVENLCQDVVLMTKSRVILAGDLAAARKASRSKSVRLRMEAGDYGFLDRFTGISMRDGQAGSKEITLGNSLTPQELLHTANSHGVVLDFSLGEASLRDIYLEKVGEASA